MRYQHDKRRQVFIGTAKTIGNPRTKAGSARELCSGLHEGNRRVVIDGLGMQRFHETQRIGNFGDVRQQLAYAAAFFPTWDNAFATELVERWRLPANERIGPLSLGQKQKVAIVRALLTSPVLLLLDRRWLTIAAALATTAFLAALTALVFGANIWLARSALFVEAAGSLLNDSRQWKMLLRKVQARDAIIGKGPQSARAAVVLYDCETFTRANAAEASGPGLCGACLTTNYGIVLAGAAGAAFA